MRILPSAIAAILIACAVPPSARAQAAHPAVELVRALYAKHGAAFRGKGTSPIEGGPPAAPYFHPSVARDLKAKRLSFDPLYDGQDAKITELSIRLDPEMKVLRGTAFVRVTFRNFGKPIRLIFRLRQGPNGWRIFDIQGPRWTLVKTLKTSPPA